MICRICKHSKENHHFHGEGNYAIIEELGNSWCELCDYEPENPRSFHQCETNLEFLEKLYNKSLKG